MYEEDSRTNGDIDGPGNHFALRCPGLLGRLQWPGHRDVNLHWRCELFCCRGSFGGHGRADARGLGLAAAVQDAEAYTDLSVYSAEVADLFTRSLENARASFDDPNMTSSQVAGRAQQLESMMVVMDQETGAWMEKS